MADRARGIRRFWRYPLGVVLIAIVALGLGTLVPRPLFVSPPWASASAEEPVVKNPARTVLLLSSAIHTDLALPADPDVAARFAFMAKDGLDPAQPGVGHIIAGWGGRSFYIETPTWSDLKPGPAFSALTLDRSVMHMGLAGKIDPDHPSVTAIELDEASFQRMLGSILASFAIEPGGRPDVVAGANYGDYDLFYEAEGWFNAFAGCNVWTARMLRRAGVKTGWWTPLPMFLTTSLGLHNSADGSVYRPFAR